MTLRQCYRESGLSSSNISACVSLCHLIIQSQFPFPNGFAYDCKRSWHYSTLSSTSYLIHSSTPTLAAVESYLTYSVVSTADLFRLSVFHFDDLIGIEREIVAWFGPLACGVLPFLATLLPCEGLLIFCDDHFR